MKHAHAVFFITTARSATQWIASALGEAYADLLDAAHEPMGYRYAPCRTLRDPAALADLGRDPEIRAHFDRIRHTLARGRSYVEVGFPAFALAPLLREAFGADLRLVHLTRHPVRVAASLVTHRWYVGPGREDVRGTVALTPFDPGASLTSYADRWLAMSPFEKGLYYWAEVHAWGLEVEAGSPAGAFARFRAEDLAAEDSAARRAFCAFLDLPERRSWLDAPQRRVDRFRAMTRETLDLRQTAWHPEIVALAERLGYDPIAIESDALRARYVATSTRRDVVRALQAGTRRVMSFLIG